jgi:hypothetical protein
LYVVRSVIGTNDGRRRSIIGNCFVLLLIIII